MSVVFDANVLIDLLHPKTHADKKVRLEHLVAELQKQRTQVLIATPSLTEVLVKADKASQEYLNKLSGGKSFRIVPFGQRAAVECAVAMSDAVSKGDKRGGLKGTWAKVKFDRQIVAIAVAEGAKVIYSDDDDIHRFAKLASIGAVKTTDLPLPPEAAQGNLPL